MVRKRAAKECVRKRFKKTFEKRFEKGFENKVGKRFEKRFGKFSWEKSCGGVCEEEEGNILWCVFLGTSRVVYILDLYV